MNLRTGLAIALLVLVAGGSFGCKEEGPAEKLGRQMDEAAEDLGDSLEDAADEAKKKLE